MNNSNKSCFQLDQLKAALNKSESESLSVVSNSLPPHGLYSPWNSPGQNTGVGSLSLLQGVFPTQESNWGLLHCRRNLYQLSYQGFLNCHILQFKKLYLGEFNWLAQGHMANLVVEPVLDPMCSHLGQFTFHCVVFYTCPIVESIFEILL